MDIKKQHAEIARLQKKFDFTPGQMADAMGVPYDCFKNWTGARGTTLPPLGWRVLVLLEMAYQNLSWAQWRRLCMALGIRE